MLDRPAPRRIFVAAGVGQVTVRTDVAWRRSAEAADGFAASEILIRPQCWRTIRHRHQHEIPLRQSVHHGALAENLSTSKGQDRYALDLGEHRDISTPTAASRSDTVPGRFCRETGRIQGSAADVPHDWPAAEVAAELVSNSTISEPAIHTALPNSRKLRTSRFVTASRTRREWRQRSQAPTPAS